VEGLTLAAVPVRGSSGDVFVSEKWRGFDLMPAGAVVGTSSLRRRAQLLHRRPDLQLVDMRGNVETRLRKLSLLGLDAIILAQAGLERLGLGNAITEVLDPAWMVPAVGQGALGLECRSDDATTLRLVEQMDDASTRQAVLAERAFLRALGGGCVVPIGGRAVVSDAVLTLRGVVLPPSGAQRLAGVIDGPGARAEALGRTLADQLLARGARDLLSRVP
jgi:hydroxymethylbilane synthase